MPQSDPKDLSLLTIGYVEHMVLQHLNNRPTGSINGEQWRSALHRITSFAKEAPTMDPPCGFHFLFPQLNRFDVDDLPDRISCITMPDLYDGKPGFVFNWLDSNAS